MAFVWRLVSVAFTDERLEQLRGIWVRDLAPHLDVLRSQQLC
jgi:hypothetical protein